MSQFNKFSCPHHELDAGDDDDDDDNDDDDVV